MNAKASKLRTALSSPVSAQVEPPRDDTFDADYNAKIFMELDSLQRKLKVETYIVMHDGNPVASILIRRTEATTTAIVTKFVNGRRVMFKGMARYYGGATRALEGLEIRTPWLGSNAVCTITEGVDWDRQLKHFGFEVWRTL